MTASTALTVALIVLLVAWAAARLTRFLVLDDLLEEWRRGWLLARCPPTGEPRRDVEPAVPAGKVALWRHKVGDLASCAYCAGWWLSGAMLAVAHIVGLAEWPLRWDLVLWWTVAGIQMVINAADARL